MKQHQIRKHTDRVSGAMEEIKVTAAANAVSVFAQISGLAKDKIGYGIRELSTNAWDASRGRFEVHLPTLLNPVIRWRDYGPGMSHHEMKTVYAVLYESTKRKNANEVGGWGLGSKSAFAYLIGEGGSGSYSVTCYQQGKARTYNLALNEAGELVMRLVFDFDTKEEDGFEVQYAVAKSDVDQFRQKAQQILWSFEPRPRVFPEIAWAEPKILAQGPNWKRYDQDAPFSGPQVRMGPVMYALDLHAIAPQSFLHTHDRIVFDIPIGAASVTTSRENLAYDAATKNFLNGVVSAYLDEYVASVNAKIAPEKTWFEACIALGHELSSLDSTRASTIRTKVRWQGRPLHIHFESNSRVRFMTLAKNWSESGIESFRRENFLMTSSFKKFDAVAIEHNPQRSLERLDASGLAGKRVLWIRAGRDDLAEAKAMFGGDFDYVVLDDIKLEKRVSTGEKRKKSIKARRYMTAGAPVVRNAPSGLFDLEEHGLYVVRCSGWGRSQYVEISPGKSVGHYALQRFLESSVALGVIPATTKIVIANDSLVETHKDWTMLGDFLKPKLEEKIDFSTYRAADNIQITQFSNKLKCFIHPTMAAAISVAPPVLKQLYDDAVALRTTITAPRTNVNETHNRALQALQSIGYNVTIPDGGPNPLTDLETRLRLSLQSFLLLSPLMDDIYTWNPSADSAVSAQLRHYFELLTNQASVVFMEDILEAA